MQSNSQSESETWSTVLQTLVGRYQERVSDVPKIIGAMVDAGIIDSESGIENDHIAFRTLGVPHLGIQSLEKIFLHYGYTRRDHYFFPEKKLDAFWFAPPAPGFPRIFISELRVGDLSQTGQDIIRHYTEHITSDPVNSLELDNPTAVSEFLHSGLWSLPAITDYQTLAAESEYAAWVIYNRYYLNHFTIAVHHLRQPYNQIEFFTRFLESKGFKFNDAGGKIKTSPDGLLAQSSTIAALIPAIFAGGEQIMIPGSYVEFAERRTLPDGRRREGFEAANADKIFESTYQSQVSK